LNGGDASRRERLFPQKKGRWYVERQIEVKPVAAKFSEKRLERGKGGPRGSVSDE